MVLSIFCCYSWAPQYGYFMKQITSLLTSLDVGKSKAERQHMVRTIPLVEMLWDLRVHKPQVSTFQNNHAALCDSSTEYKSTTHYADLLIIDSSNLSHSQRSKLQPPLTGGLWVINSDGTNAQKEPSEAFQPQGWSWPPPWFLLQTEQISNSRKGIVSSYHLNSQHQHPEKSIHNPTSYLPCQFLLFYSVISDLGTLCPQKSQSCKVMFSVNTALICLLGSSLTKEKRTSWYWW